MNTAAVRFQEARFQMPLVTTSGGAVDFQTDGYTYIRSCLLRNYNGLATGLTKIGLHTMMSGTYDNTNFNLAHFQAGTNWRGNGLTDTLYMYNRYANATKQDAGSDRANGGLTTLYPADNYFADYFVFLYACSRFGNGTVQHINSNEAGTVRVQNNNTANTLASLAGEPAYLTYPSTSQNGTVWAFGREAGQFDGPSALITPALSLAEVSAFFTAIRAGVKL